MLPASFNKRSYVGIINAMAEKGFVDAPRIEIARVLEKIPAWFVRDDRPESPDELVLAAARRSFLYKRYRRLLEEEGRYWGEAALDLLRKGEVPRWVDQRRYISQYTEFGKESWVALYGILFHRQLGELLARCRGLSGPVLDLGCGCGWLALELARIGKEVVGIDISESSIGLARFFFDRRHVDTETFPAEFCGLRMEPPERQGSVRYEVQDLNSLKLPRNSFSSVVSWEALHHIHNLEGLAGQVAASLKPGGFFIVHETVNESVNGASLHDLLTRPRMLRLVKARHSKHQRRGPRTSQQVLFEELKRSYSSLEAGNKVPWSPFEGVSGGNMLGILKKYFQPTRASYHHHFLTEDGAFRIIRAWTEHLGFAPSPRFTRMVFGMLSRIDSLAIRLGGCSPRHAFLVLKPRKNIQAAGLTIKEEAERLAKRPLMDEDWESLLRLASDRIEKAGALHKWDRDLLDVYSVAESFKGRIAPAGERDRLMLVSGWHLKEGDYRWTDGHGRAFFCFPEGSRQLEIEMMGAPSVSPSRPQSVRIAVESDVLGEISISSRGWQKRTVPVADVPRSVVTISIVSDAVVPKELGLSDDLRRLGVAVKSIRAL